MDGMDLPGSFVLLSGPAGFGKTTLLSEWIAQLRQPVGWVSLDEGDNDPTRFWLYLITALQSVENGIAAAALESLRTPQPLPADTIPTILINDLAALDRDLVLVLDDFHTIQHESILRDFAFLLEHLPGNLHLLVSTRVDPPWPLARFRARNQLVEVRAQDLRFTGEEAAVFLSRMMGMTLPNEAVAALETRTEGWAAGLQLAALSMQGRSDISSFIKSFSGSHVYVAEYLVEEVLQRQPEEVQAFLLKTSILKRMSASLCESVTGLPDGQYRLAALHRANLFVIPLDDEGQWFRYHQLFADLLRVHLQATFSEYEIANLHKVSAGWFEQHRLILEAVNHALAAKDFESAARLIGENAAQIVTRGELSTLMRWIEALPADLIWHHPQIFISKIWALTLSGAVRQIEPLLQQAEDRFDIHSKTSVASELAGFTAAIRAFLAMMAGDDQRALELAERAEQLLPEGSVHVRWLLPYTTGAAYRGQGQYEKAAEAFARQAAMGDEHDHLVVWGTGVTALALVRRAQGRLKETIQICTQARHRLEVLGAAGFGSLAKLEVPLVEVLCQQNQLDEARQRLAGVMDRMRSWPMPTDRLHAQLALIEIQQAQGDLESAFETLRAAKDLTASHAVLMNLARSVDLWEIRLALKTGDTITADRLLEQLQPAASGWVELRDQKQLLLSRLRLAQGKPDDARRITSQLASEAKAGERTATLIEALTLQACALHAQGEVETALVVLTKALALAEPEGYVRVFVDEGDVMEQLLAAVASQLAKDSDNEAFPSKAYVAELLAAFPGRPLSPLAPVPPDQATGLVEPLTPRELEVLELIAAGDSNRTIAEKLVITVSAVKKHTGNIYGKLDVNSRTQAVARARQLGLLAANE
jgi:LuxR family transcriptional regulator, maltose regulon positive regulatory protein